MNAAAAAEYRSLARERDPEFYAESLLAFAQRQEISGQTETAAAIYAELSGEAPNASLRARARERLAVLGGGGPTALRAEHLLRHLARETMEPSTLIGMTAASAVFRLTRVAGLSRLLASPTANFATRGWGARLLAGSLAFGAEATVFPLATRAAGMARGREFYGSLDEVGRDLASSFILLGAMKLAGGAVSLSPARGWRAGVLGQTGMLGGIALGHRLESAIGLRPHADAATTLVDSLAMLLQFHAAGRLAQGIMGPGFQAWETSLEGAARRLGSTEAGARPIRLEWEPALAFAGASRMESAESRGRRPALDASKGIMAMSMDSTEGGTKPSEALPESRDGGVFYFPGKSVPAEAPLIPQISYPPEIETMMEEVEAAIRAPGYLKGSRRELMRKRPAADAVDRIWIHQNLDLLNLDWVQVEVRDADIFRTSLNSEERAPDGDLVTKALQLLGSRGRPGSFGRTVLEVRFSREKLMEGFFGDPLSRDASISLFGSISETQNILGHRVHFMSEDRSLDGVLRLPTLSLLEAFLQARFGRRAAQFHLVDGAITRDETMHLRRRKISAVGYARQLIYLGDIKNLVFPSAFTNHDASFHGAMDAAAEPAMRVLAGRIYDWLGRNGDVLEPGIIENLRDRLSDGELGKKHDIIRTTLGIGIIEALRTAGRARSMEPSPFARRRGLREIHELTGRMAELVARPWEGSSFITQEQYRNHNNFRKWRGEIRNRYLNPTFFYGGEMAPVVAEIERAKGQADYLSGTREELLAKRPRIQTADRLWFHQALDFAGYIPGMRVRELDAAVLGTGMPRQMQAPDRDLLRVALEALDERAAPGSQHRRLLEFIFPARMLDLESALFAAHPRLRFLAGMPFVPFLEKFLDHRLPFLGGNEGYARMRIPSLSLVERLTQLVHGAEAAQFHFVSGEIPRDDAMRLRADAVNVVGLSANAHYFSEYEGDIHPFSFTGHDAFEHAMREARIAPRLRAFAGRFYFSVSGKLPASPLRELLLNDISDFYQAEGQEPGALAAHWVSKRLESALARTGNGLDPAVRRGLESALSLAQITLDLGERNLPELRDASFRDPVLALRASLLAKLRGEGG